MAPFTFLFICLLVGSVFSLRAFAECSVETCKLASRIIKEDRTDVDRTEQKYLENGSLH